MQINSTQSLNAYTAVQPVQGNTNTPPAQQETTGQPNPIQDAAVVEISQEATAQLAATEDTTVQPPPAQPPQAQDQPPAQPEQYSPMIDIVA